MKGFINTYIMPEFDRYREFVQEYQNHIYIASSLGKDSTPTHLPRTVEKNGGNTSSFLQELFRFGGNPPAYDIFLIMEIEEENEPDPDPEPEMSSPVVRRCKEATTN